MINNNIGKDPKKRLKRIAILIECFDSMRKGHLYAQDKLTRELKKLGGFGEELKYVKKDFKKAEVTVKFMEGKKFRRLIRITDAIGMICLQYIIISMIFALIWRSQANAFEQFRVFFSLPVMFSISALMIFYVITKRHLDKKIKTITYKRSLIRGRNKRLKEITQKFINILHRELLRSKEDPKKFPFRIYNIDYENIKIMHKPGFLRNHYVVIASINERE